MRSGFNEAGAINPGKRVVPESDQRSQIRFNEAGAINPGKLVFAPSIAPRLMIASMRPGQLTPENGVQSGVHLDRQRASMRPGQLTPENSPRQRQLQRFAERASMRPGQLTPENSKSAITARSIAASLQ